jgi:hypothetical protein
MSGSKKLKIPLIVLMFLVIIFSCISVSNVETIKSEAVFTNFITRNTDKLMDGGNEFRFISVNCPNLFFSYETDYGLVPFSTIEEQIKTVAQMGGKVIRTFTFSVRRNQTEDKDELQSPYKKTFINSPSSYDEECFRNLDKAIELANLYGIRLIVPFFNWYEYGGDIGDFASMVPGKTYKDFYTDTTVKNNTKNLFNYVLNRTNYYTGVQYKNDKTILAWETGNELNVDHLSTLPDSWKNKPHNSFTGLTNTDLDNWTLEMSSYMKSIDSNHLIADGRYGISSTIVNGTNDVDIVSNHYYSGDYVANCNADRNTARNKKAFIVGEYGDYNNNQVFSDDLLDTVISNGTSGAMLWSLYPHYWNGGLFRKTDMHVYHYPGFQSGASYSEEGALECVKIHANEINGNVIYDDIENYSKMYSKSSSGLTIATNNTSLFNGDANRLTRTGTTQERYAIYKAPTNKHFVSFMLDAYYLATETVTDIKVYTSSDNITYNEFTITYKNDLGGNWKRIQYEGRLLPYNTQYIKVGLNNTLRANSPQLARAEFVYSSPIISPDTPVMLPISSINNIKWVGSYGATSYDIERSETINGTYKVVGISLTDDSFPFSGYNDLTAVEGRTYYYRVKANNVAGSSTVSEPVCTVANVATTLVDDLENLSKTSSYSSNISIDTNSQYFKNDTARAYRTDNNLGYVIYKLPSDIISYNITFFGYPSCEGWQTVLTSKDGLNYEYTQETYNFTGGIGGSEVKLNLYSLGVEPGTRYVKIFLTPGGSNYDKELGRVEISYGNNLVADDSFEHASTSWNAGANISLTNTDKNTGVYSYLINGSGGLGNLYQTIQVTANKDYTMTFNAKSSSTGLWAGITKTDWTANLANVTSNSTNNWTKYTLQFNSGNNTSLILRFVDYLGGKHYIDDVCLNLKNNLVSNDDFESTSAWTLQSGFAYSSEDKYTQAQSIKLVGTGSGNNLYQTLNVLQNTNYVFSFYAKSSGAGLWYGIMDGSWSSIIVNDYTQTNNVWTKYKLFFNSGTNTSIYLRLADVSGTHFIDDVNLSVDNENLISNGTFEGTFAAWGHTSEFALTSTDKKSGSYSVLLNGTGGGNNLYQTVSVKANTNYILSFYAKCSSTGLNYSVGDTTWTSTIVSNVSLGNNVWTKYTLVFNSGSVNSLLVRFTDLGGTHYIDEVDIRPDSNMITNPGFEMSGSNFWSMDSVFSITSAEKNSGYNSVMLSGTNNSGNMFQYINVTPNTDYIFSFYAKCSTTGLWYGITNASWTSDLAFGTSTANNVWTKYTLTFNSGNNLIVAVRFADLGGTHYFDDVEFTFKATTAQSVVDDNSPPVVVGVEDKHFYDIANGEVKISINEGNAILNGEQFVKEHIVNQEGDYSLTVSDSYKNTTAIEFYIYKLTLSIQSTNGVIKDFSQNTTLSTAKSLFELSPNLVFSAVNSNGQPIDETQLITTGTEIIISHNGNEFMSYFISILGDTNADGIINVGDLARVKQSLLRQLLLENLYVTAADYNGNGLVTISDLVALKKVLIS